MSESPKEKCIEVPVSQDRATQLAYFAMLPLNKPGQREQVMEALKIDAKEVAGLLRPLPQYRGLTPVQTDPSTGSSPEKTTLALDK